MVLDSCIGGSNGSEGKGGGGPEGSGGLMDIGSFTGGLKMQGMDCGGSIMKVHCDGRTAELD